ncbi:YrhC family protein [Peribacillus kribbensis]|uniref:YrhC family protein n=1 Tax=Peribacillus kribbensis TaxID=356658 RepID=UPI00040C7DA8|nr:YrhC family protein [Peribacillus kribbensis]
MFTKGKSITAIYREKMIDFKRYAFLLVCTSVFFYLGVIIPSDGKGLHSNSLLMASTAVFLGLSILFFVLSAKYKGLLADIEE